MAPSGAEVLSDEKLEGGHTLVNMAKEISISCPLSRGCRRPCHFTNRRTHCTQAWSSPRL